VPLPELLKEGERQMTICNACRYCEGYCAVFPAMELRRTFSKGDLVYLANLCFDCRDCYYASPRIRGERSQAHGRVARGYLQRI
jgi:MinD superfamily P-loop ATPase